MRPLTLTLSPAGRGDRTGTAGVAGLVFLLLLGLAGAAFAQGIRVTVDRPEATIQDQLTLQVTVEGSQRAQPRLPDLTAFKVYSAGQQSQMQFKRGRTSVAVTYSYTLVPKSTGTFTIGEAVVEIDGRTYKSRPFQVRILETTATPQQSDALFVTARVSDDNPYVGEQVIYTWRFYRRVQVVDAQIDPLEFDGFLVEELGELREYTTTRKGQEYLVSELRRALFPQEEGTLTITPSLLRCEVVVRRRRGFFSRDETQAKVLRGSPIEVKVRPLPAAPKGFSGLVGDFKLRARLPKRELKVGESATWKLTVSGTGNVWMIAEPRLPEMAQFKIYDDKPTSSIERSGVRLTGSRSFTKALVPLEAGELTVPPVRLTYFDTEAGTYRSVSTAAITLVVSPADGKEELRLTESVAPTTGKVAVRILADDILPIYKDLDAVRPTPFGHRVSRIWLAGLLAPPLFFFGLLFVERRRKHFEENVHLVRRRSALRKAFKGLAEVAKTAKAGDHREAAQLASRVMRKYVGDKVALEGNAFTSVEAEAQLRKYGVDADVVRETRQHLENLEAVQYAGIRAEEIESLADQLKPLLRQLERQIHA